MLQKQEKELFDIARLKQIQFLKKKSKLLSNFQRNGKCCKNGKGTFSIRLFEASEALIEVFKIYYQYLYKQKQSHSEIGKSRIN